MARKATIDVDRAMQMLREGESTQAVAEHFGVSRQAIDLHRRKFIESGQLADRRAPRTTAPSSGGYNAGIKAAPPAVPLDGLIELVIQAFDSLKKLPNLEAELEKYKQDYARAAERIEMLEKEVSRRKEQEARWGLAVQPGDVTQPPNGK